MSCSSTDTVGPAQVNLVTTRGDSFGFKIRLWQDPAKTVPADLSGATVTAQLRQTPDSTDVEASFTTAISSNEVTLTLLPTETAVLPSRCVWDVQIDWDSGGTSIQTVVRGALVVGPDVTR